MNINTIKEGLKKTRERLHGKLNRLLGSVLGVPANASERTESTSSKPQVVAYRLIGERTVRLLPLFRDMDVNLQKSGMKVSFKGYVSLTLLTTFIALTSTSFVVPVIILLVFHLPIFLCLLYTVGAILFAGAFSILGFYLYPIIRKDSVMRKLEEGLPFTTGYLSILAGAGVPPSQMFRSLAKTDPSLAVCEEAKDIVRDVELFGVDLISAMEAASKRTPSERFKDLLEGFIATMHAGGNLPKYLSERSRQYMRLKRIALRRLADTLAVLAEFYVVMLVAGPLILVVMLAVMAMLGSGVSGLMNPRLLLYLLTYVGLPVGSVIFLIMLDVISPKR